MGAVGVSNYDGVTSPAYDILKPIRELKPEFYHHLFRTNLYRQQFKQHSRGIMDMRLRLYFDQFGQIPIIIPPIKEQAQISVYCSNATANLDKAIEATYHEFTLLKEYRARLISDVVTGKTDVRGIDLPATIEADLPQESSDLLENESAMEDQEMEEEITIGQEDG